jgi:hypothetical protein
MAAWVATILSVMPAASRGRVDDGQLCLPLALLSEQDALHALRVRGVDDVHSIHFRANRSNLISISADRRRLNLHECFRAGGPDVLDAIAAFARARGNNPAYRQAIARLRRWHGAQVRESDAGSARRPPACCGTPAQQHALAHCYRQLNRVHFAGALPELLPVRLSDRMRRRLGHVQYGSGSQQRTVSEIALNVDLLLPGNGRALRDTLLHEMAHVEAWLLHGQRGHGRVWQCVARRVGCEARACSEMRIRRRRRGSPPTEAVPAVIQATIG